MDTWMQEFYSLLEIVIDSPYGSAPFWVTTGIALTCLLIIGWLISNFVFQAKRGFIVTLIANLIPAAAAAAGWIAVTIYAVPELGPGIVRDYLPLGAAILGAFLATMLISRFLFGISEMATIFSMILTYGCVAAAIFFGGTIAGEVDSGLDSIEEKKEERKSETESLLSN